MKNAALRSFRLAARGFARLLLQASVTAKDAEAVLREAFVEVALRDYGLRGRPTNASRVALLTGLDRREVARVRDRLGAREAAGPDETHPLSRVLSGWHLDPDFTDDGAPRALATDDDVNGLPALFARYAPGLPQVAVRKELQRVGALAVSDGQARALMRYYLDAELNAASVRRYGSVANDLLATLNHNVLRDDPAHPRFEGRAVNLKLSPERAEALRRWLDAEGERFLERVDAWLEANADADGTVRAGVGLYLIHDEGDPS